MSNLVIVESPAKAKTIEKYLGKDFIVRASMGHVRDLPRKKISIDIENNFKPLYEAMPDKEKILLELRKYADKCDTVYLATDPDREGEAISWHLKEMMFLGDARVKRVTFNEITEKAVKKAMQNPRNIDMELVNAQQARRLLDRIVGYKLSPFLWKKVKRGLSAGRVQSVATRMVVEREILIRAFNPEEYWSINAFFKVNKNDNNNFSSYFYGDLNGKIELKTQAETEKVLKGIENKDYTVKTIKKGKRSKKPAPPFITSSLQQDASRKLGMSPKKTMMVAQGLYEGVNIPNQGLTGLITYMRTDSLRISDEARDMGKDYILSKYGQDFYIGREFKTKKSSQDAHEAIRPSYPGIAPDDIKDSLNVDQYKLYKLIWSRFMASLMTDAKYDTVSSDIQCGEYIFRATGSVITFAGYTAVYEESTDEATDEDGKLPVFNEGDKLFLDSLQKDQHFTQPPARYTEASLIRAMEEQGVGRPSTYAPTISTIIDRDYVEKDKKNLKPTPLGEGVTSLMIDHFGEIVQVSFTAKMEDELDKIEAGEETYPQVLEKFYAGFEKALIKAETDMGDERIKIAETVTDIPCDLCQSMLVIKSGRFGKFMACPSYPECKFTKPIVVQAGFNCPVCDNPVLSRKSQKGYAYFGCQNNSIKKEDGTMLCDFMTWDKPTKELCPDCAGVLFKSYNREEKETSIVCLRPTCSYKQVIAKKEPATKATAKKASTKKATTKKTTAKKATAKKPSTKKTAVKDTADKKEVVKKAPVKKATTKKATTKKATIKKSETKAEKETTKKATTKKTAIKKPSTKKSDTK